MRLLATAPTSLIVPWNTSNIVTVPFSSSSKSLFSWDLDEKLLSFREAAMTVKQAMFGGYRSRMVAMATMQVNAFDVTRSNYMGKKFPSIRFLGDDQSKI